MSTTEQVLVKQYGEETPWPEPRTFGPPYQTRATVAGNRLSDLIDALRRFDPDTRIEVERVELKNERIRMDVEVWLGADGGWDDGEAIL